MSRFEIFEVDSDSENTDEFIPKIADSLLSWKYKEYKKQALDTIHGRTVLLTFICMSNQRKMNLLTYMFHSVCLCTLADILNIFSAVYTKLISYSKISNDSNSLYEQFVQDDDRMLDLEALEESLMDTKEWFKNLDDVEQTNMVTSLLRLSGGNVIKKMYLRMIKIFNKRSAEGDQEFKEYKSYTNVLFVDNANLIQFSAVQPRYVAQDEEDDYDSGLSTNLKVVDARKQWQANITKLRKEIEQEIQILNEPTLQKRGETPARSTSASRKKKGEKNDATKKRVVMNNMVDSDYDWLQFLPLWNVKKIFSYLDQVTLQNLKKVNNYWATLSKEVLEERKTREYLNSIIRKSEEFFETSLGIPQTTSKMEIPKDNVITEPSSYWKTIEKQRKTGTTIRRKKEVFAKLQNVSAVDQCLNEFYTKDIPFLNELKTFPVDFDVDMEYMGGKSSSVSSSRVLNSDNRKFGAEGQLLRTSDDEESSATSTMSLVPSIVVSTDSMQTW